jgi:lysophospholipase L1-like esterase
VRRASSLAATLPLAAEEGSGAAVLPARRPPSRRRRLVLATVTTLVPFAVLLAAEGALRVAGFGDAWPLFVPVPEAPGHLRASREAVRRLVPGDAEVPNLWIRPVFFPADKPPGTFRIVVQGGSTAEGYPYGYGASPAGMLQQRLQRTFPDTRIEVITTAMSAMNSYALLDFSGEILEQQPDAVLVYAGHNEYLGVLGVGSGFSLGKRRPLVLAALAMKDLRLLQLARRGLSALAPAADDQAQAATGRGRRTLMARIVAEDRIPYGSPLYRRGLDQYEANLRALLRRYRRAGVPVWIGTLASNLRDRPPFIAGHAAGADVARWRRQMAAGEAALAVGDAAAALAAFEAAVAADDLHAGGHFARGRALERLGRNAGARAAYAAARDRDELRFRAPSAINRILRQVAAEEGARVVEVEAAFDRAAANGLVGHDLMLEHLHPNVDGYFLLADAFYRALREDGAIGSWEGAVPAAQARREVPVTEVDRLYGEWRVGGLTAEWPFADPPRRFEVPPPANEVEAIAEDYLRGRVQWPDAMRALLDHYRQRGDRVEAARVAVLLAEAFPHRRDDQRAAAAALAAAGRPDAGVYRRRADALPAEPSGPVPS